MVVPVSMIGSNPFGKQTIERSMKSFNVAIGRRFVCGRSDLVDGEIYADFLEQLAFKVLTAIGQDLLWESVNAEDLVNQYLSDGRRFLVLHWEYFYPFREMVNHCQNVDVSFRRCWIWSSNIDAETLPGLSNDHGLQLTLAAILKSFVPCTLWTLQLSYLHTF